MLDSLKKIYRLFPRKDRVKLGILFFMMLVAAGLEVLGIGMIPIFVIAVSDPENLMQYPVLGDLLLAADITTAEELVVWGAILLIAVYVVKNVYLSFFIYLKKKFITNRGVALENRLFKAYMASPYTFYISRNSAELLRNVTSETKKVVEGTMLPFMEVALNIVMFVVILGALLVIEPLITVVTIFFLGIAGGLFLKYTRVKSREYGRDDRRARKQKNKSVLQGLGGLKATRVLNREQLFLNEYAHWAERSKIANIYKYVVKMVPKFMIETLAVTGILIIALILVWEGRAIAAIIPILALFGAATVRLMPVFNQVISQTTTIQYNAPSVDAVYDDMVYLEKEYVNVRKEILSKKVEKLELKSAITLDGVSYSYPGQDGFAVNDVSLDIEQGSAVAFVGESGAGKTSIADIILGLLEPQKGRILADGIDIESNIRGWQQNIGYIPQQIFLLDDSVRRNIAFGIPDELIDDNKVLKAVEAAQLGELLERLPKGINTRVGERGVLLSGGQQQRIGIARALYDNPQVLIMDEATSALDNITEKYVIEAIEKLRGNRTIIMIAHRLTTVEKCDTICLMKGGQIVEKGRFEELLKNSYEFRKMSLIDY
ncbi:MAG: ABC transporter ATP-binding protein [Balneolaceae bacterium]|nr:ABC transporter ATP-binding protein [Balneolaceae bacterium]MCH8550214.1 ABC transporter ATP-binding protein/permease [Balneolaceae bacterium]